MFKYNLVKNKKSFNLYNISSNKNIFTEYSQQPSSKSKKNRLKIGKSAKILKIKPQKKLLLFNIPNSITNNNNINILNTNSKIEKIGKVDTFPQTTTPSMRIKKILKIPKRNKNLSNNNITKYNISNNISKYSNNNISNKLKDNLDLFKNKSFLKDLINLKYNTNENTSKLYTNNDISTKKNHSHNSNNSNITKKNNSKIRLIKNSVPLHIKERLIFNKKKSKKEITSINNYNSKYNNNNNFTHTNNIDNASKNNNKENISHQREQKNTSPSITLTIRYKTIKFDMVLTHKDSNSFIITERINECLNLCLNDYQLNYLAKEIAKEINNIIKNVIIFPSVTYYSSIIDLDKIINECNSIKEQRRSYYKVNVKFRNNKYNFITKENEENFGLIADNILSIINEGGKYQEMILKNVIIQNIRKSIFKTNSRKSLFSTEESKNIIT